MSDMPEIFVQISDPANPEQYKVITGLCLLVRNPAFHPYTVWLSQLIVVAISELSKQLSVMIFSIWYLSRSEQILT
jgi:RNA-dependent RNA polymerase